MDRTYRSIKRRASQTQTKKISLRNLRIALITLFYVIFCLIFLTQIALAGEHNSKIQKPNELDYLIDLEGRVWSSQDSQLSDLESEISKNIQISPHSSFMHYLLGQINIRKFMLNPYEMHLLRQAAEMGQQAIDLRPDKDFGYVIAAQVLDMMGYSDNALKLIDNTFNTKIKDSWRTWFLKSKIKAASHTFHESLSIYEKSLESSYTQTHVVIPHVIALIESHTEGEKLVSELRSWLKTSDDDSLVKISLAIALTDQGDYAEAEKLYKSIPAKDNYYIESMINRSILQYNYLNQRKDAQLTLENLRHSQQFKNLDSEKKILVLGHLANIHLLEKDYHKAEAYFVETVLGSPTPMNWVSFIHNSYKKDDKFKELANLMERLKHEIPGMGAIYALQGTILSEKLQQHQDAINAYEDAILLEPNRSEFYTGLGLAYYREKNMDKALDLFAQATRVDPSNATARYNEACVLSLLGRSSEALGSLKEAINLDPELISAAEQDQDFENIRELSLFAEIINKRHHKTPQVLVEQKEELSTELHTNVRLNN